MNRQNPDIPERKKNAVEISHLHFGYSNVRPVLHDISLTIKSGERLGLIGPSGAGKSTLLLHLNGILTGSGIVKIGDQIVSKKTMPEIRQKVGLVFQNPDDQLFNPTVEEDIAFGPINMGLSNSEVTRRVKHALQAMNLQGFEKMSSHHLSYGERKRVALATVLSMQPEVIAFDEPFSNLDPAMIHQLIEIIKNLPVTVIIVSQMILSAISCCDRLAILKDGKIIAVGPTPEIAHNRALLQACGLDYSMFCQVCKKLSPPNE